jgi:hypothetical protein
MSEKNKLSQKGLKTLIDWLKKEIKLAPMKPDIQSFQVLNNPSKNNFEPMIMENPKGR